MSQEDVDSWNGSGIANKRKCLFQTISLSKDCCDGNPRNHQKLHQKHLSNQNFKTSEKIFLRQSYFAKNCKTF